MTRRLSRTTWPAAGQRAPVRVVHLGLGAFHRAHQAWYTHQATLAGGEPAGVAAFTGRRPDAAVPLDEQDGLYGLVVRGHHEDAVDVVASISAAHRGDDGAALARYLADPRVSVLTLTVTEAGYWRDANGGLASTAPEVAADIAALRAGDGPLHTAPARLLAGLVARRAADAGPLAVVPCDNLMANGQVLRTLMHELAEHVDAGLVEYLDETVSFVSTTVDRITPATTDTDRALATEALGLTDAATVVTEPFTEWVLADAFPAGRPSWELAGAEFVDDVTPFEQRKLHLLNGAHSLLAYAGLALGHATIAEAAAEDGLRALVEQWWSEASRHLSLPAAEVSSYRAALLARFANPRLHHLLRQVAADGSEKLPVRMLPVVRAERAAGRTPTAAVYVLGAWLAHLRRTDDDVVDPRAELLRSRVAVVSVDKAVRGLFELVAADLADDDTLTEAVAEACTSMETP